MKKTIWIFLSALICLIIISAFCEAPLGICGYLIAALMILEGQFPKKFGGRYQFFLKYINLETWEKVHLIISACLTVAGTIGLLVKIIF